MRLYRVGVCLVLLFSISFSLPAFSQQEPIIKKVNKSTCYKFGEKIEVYGKNFGSPKAFKLVMTDGAQVYTVNDIQQWQVNKITALLPKEIKPTKGKLDNKASYRIGIARASVWLSNRNIAINFCDTKMSRATSVLTLKTEKRPIKNLKSNEKISDTKIKPVETEGIDVGAVRSEVDNRSSGSLSGLGEPPKVQMHLALNESERDNQQEPKEAVIVSSSIGEALAFAKQAKQYGIQVKRRNRYPELGIVVSVLRIPADLETANVIQQLRADNKKLWIDFNHRYQLLSSKSKPMNNPKYWAYDMLGWSEQHRSCQPASKIGLIDTGIAQIKSLPGPKIIQNSMLSNGVQSAKKDHGTAIASLLLGSSEKKIPGLLPKTSIYSAEVFRQRGKKKVDTNAELIVKAMAWLAGKKVSVINLSLGGPRNLIVEAAIHRLYAKGVIVVSAAGIDSRGNPLYPAAQKEVVAVRAIDANERPFSYKIKGDYIDFAAPGVDLWLLNEKGKARYMSGSSFAVPFIAASYLLLNKKSNQYDTLKKSVRDLGDQGKDDYFGWGLVVAKSKC